MEHSRKMVVVPQELLTRIQNNQQQHDTSTYTGGLDDEMQRILNDKRSTDDGEKWKLYQQVLQRYLHVSTANRKPINLPIIETSNNQATIDDDEEEEGGGGGDSLDVEIIESLPYIYRVESRGLLRALRRRGKNVIRWNRNGVVYVHGELIPNSNIVDIIHNIVRARKTTHLPSGWIEVMRVLKDMNIPSTYIGNSNASDFLNRTRTPTSDTVTLLHTPTSSVAATDHKRRQSLLLPSRLTFPPTPDATPPFSSSSNSSSSSTRIPFKTQGRKSVGSNRLTKQSWESFS